MTFLQAVLKGVQCQLCCEADGGEKGGCESDHLAGKLIYVTITSLQIGFIDSLHFLPMKFSKMPNSTF